MKESLVSMIDIYNPLENIRAYALVKALKALTTAGQLAGRPGGLVVKVDPYTLAYVCDSQVKQASQFFQSSHARFP